jgi:hypothetical protein
MESLHLQLSRTDVVSLSLLFGADEREYSINTIYA